MPSPISDRRFCTRKAPISGAKTPTATQAASARCMYARSNGHGSGSCATRLHGGAHRSPSSHERQVLAVHAQADAGLGELGGGPSNTMRR